MRIPKLKKMGQKGILCIHKKAEDSDKDARNKYHRQTVVELSENEDPI